MQYSRKILLLAFPAVTIAAGAAVLITGYIDYKKELSDIEKLFAAHADSLAALLAEGTREASASTSLIYEVTESHLAASAHLLSAAADGLESNGAHLMSDHGVSVLLTLDAKGTYSGHWGNIPPNERAAFISWMNEYEEDVLVDDGPNRALDLACLRYMADGNAAGIICLPAEKLTEMRREIGIGPLLKKVIQKDVRYVALQDRVGVIAAAPADAPILGGTMDSDLARVLEDTASSGISRYFQAGDTRVFERLIPFVMPDESRVVLRLGIDASVPAAVQRKAARRFLLSLSMVLSVTVLTAFLAGLVWARSRRAEVMARRLADEQEARKHWSAIGQMAATVAHEVRNPLNTIGMVAQRLKAELDVPEADRPGFEEMIALLQSESDRVGRVVTEFLDLGKPLTLHPEDLSMRRTVDEILFPAQLRAAAEGKQVTVLHQGDETLRVDKERFRQMLSNVVDNALDAVEKSGAVRVETLPAGDEMCLIRVVDDGPGIPEDSIAEVMKPFVSLKKTGTGLGLPLVKRIVEAHGGALRLISAPDKGTTVEMRLPRSTLRAAREAKK